MKSKFFLCIRPVVTETEDGERQRYVVVSKERSSSTRKLSPPSSTERERERERSSVSVTEEFSRISTDRRRQGSVGSGSHRTFSQAVKAVLFEVSLRKSVRESHNLGQLTPRSSSNGSERRNSINLERSIIETRQLQPGPISPTPSLSSTNSLTSKKKQNTPNKYNSRLNYGMYMFVIALFVTMFWGKAFGILCTSIWLYVVPRQRGGGIDSRSSSCRIKLPETEEETVEYNKRVIMGGFLERSHRREIEKGH